MALTITTGKLKSFNPGGDISDLTITIAGPVGSINIDGSVTDASTISAVGPNGSIGKINIAGSMAGTISAQRAIGNVVIGGTLSGDIAGATVKNLTVGGLSTSLTIEGSIGSILCTGDLGSGVESLTVDGTLKKLKVDSNIEANITAQQLNSMIVMGSVLDGVSIAIAGKTQSVRVYQNFDGIFSTASLNTLYVLGSVLDGSDIDVSGILKSLRINGDFQAGATIEATRIIHQRILGQDAGTITAWSGDQPFAARRPTAARQNAPCPSRACEEAVPQRCDPALVYPRGSQNASHSALGCVAAATWPSA